MTQTVHRAVFRAQCKAGQETATIDQFNATTAALQQAVAAGTLLTISLFRWGVHFFIYWESVAQPIAPTALFGEMTDLLEAWPGEAAPRTFVPMLDIFHCQAPVDLAHWQRKQPIERLQGRLTRLKPEMASSYIFYHYQLQEEKPGSFDKYCLISMQENLLFFYQEVPAVVEALPRPGKLTTTNTPDHWQDVMFPHFILWDDAPPDQTIWREIEVIFHLV